jgi:hypothetical protein
MASEIFEELHRGYLSTHDRLVDYCNLLLSFIGQKYGEKEVREAWQSIIDIVHKRSLKRLEDLPHELRVETLLKEHLQHGSKVSVEEHPDRTVIFLHCCGSGGRIRAQGRTDLHPGSAIPGGTTRKSYDWAFGRKGIPYYCAHCSIISNLSEYEDEGFRLEIRYGEQFDGEGKPIDQPCQFILHKRRPGREKGTGTK